MDSKARQERHPGSGREGQGSQAGPGAATAGTRVGQAQPRRALAWAWAGLLLASPALLAGCLADARAATAPEPWPLMLANGSGRDVVLAVALVDGDGVRTVYEGAVADGAAKALELSPSAARGDTAIVVKAEGQQTSRFMPADCAQDLPPLRVGLEAYPEHPEVLAIGIDVDCSLEGWL